MPAPYGVTLAGFNAPTFEEVKAEIVARARQELGDSIDLSSESILIELIDIFTDREVDLWQAMGGVLAGAFPGSAEGALLDLNLALTGSGPKPPTKTLVDILITGTPGTSIVNPRVSIPDAPAAVFGYTGTVLIPGGGTILVEFEALDFGPLEAFAGTVTKIDTPVGGWTSAVNPNDQKFLGSSAETAAEKRLRRLREIRAQGGAAWEAILAAVSEVTGVQDVYVFENEADATVDTIPPHAVEVVVRGGTDAAIAAAIFRSKGSGIGSHGSTSIGVVDSQGGSHTIKFTRPTLLAVYLVFDVTVDARAPSNIVDLIKQAVATWGDANLQTGERLVGQQMIPIVFGTSVGVYDVPPPKIGLAPNPVSTANLLPTKRQIVDLDTSRIVVNLTRI